MAPIILPVLPRWERPFTNSFLTEKRSLILGVMVDKDWREMCGILAPLANRIYLTTVSSERTALPTELLPVCQQANPRRRWRLVLSSKTLSMVRLTIHLQSSRAHFIWWEKPSID